MSELLKEAVLEAKKLKEVAEIDAKNRIIEAVAPYIKKMIAEEVSGVNKEDFLFKEEDELALPASVGVSAPTDNLGSDTVLPKSPIESLPITPVGGTVLDLPMPDSEGKITVTFDQLFQMGNKGNQNTLDVMPIEPSTAPESDLTTTPPVAPINPIAPDNTGLPAPEIAPAMPDTNVAAPAVEEPLNQAPVPPIGESVENFKKEVSMVAEKIGYLYFRKSMPSIVKESLKMRLFNLCETLDLMKENSVVSPKQANLVENKLEFLFQKLEEAKVANIYEELQGDTMSKRLEEFAAKLFEDETSESDKTMKEALLGEDAPASSNFGDGEKASGAENESPDVHDADALATKKGDNSILEGAPASSNFGDGEKENNSDNKSPELHKGNALADEKGDNSILEVSDAELQTEVKRIRKESIMKKLKLMRENAVLTNKKADEKDAGFETGEPTVKAKESHKIADAQSKPMKECGMDMEELDMGSDLGDVHGGDDEEVELTFKVNLKDLEALLSDAEDDGSVNMDLSHEEEVQNEPSDMDNELSLSDDDEDEEIEIEDDEVPPSEDDEDKKQLLLGDDSEKEKANESKKTKGSSLTENKAYKELKAQLVENQLLTAKALYLNKFSMREDLSRKQKQKIAEYLDKAGTLEEAKSTYGKIKNILEESSTTARKDIGSSGKSVSGGSAKIMKENVGDSGDEEVNTSRWAVLAGIKQKK